MFLDDELKEIYERYDPIFDMDDATKCGVELMDACVKRIDVIDPKMVTSADIDNFVKTLKRIDASWRLFHKKYNPIFKEDSFQLYLWNIYKTNEDTRAVSVKLFKSLKWAIPSE